LRLPAGLRRLVLPQRGHMLRCQNRRVHPLQLRVRGRIHGAAMRVQGSRWILSPRTEEAPTPSIPGLRAHLPQCLRLSHSRGSHWSCPHQAPNAEQAQNATKGSG
ncbi:Uncharacterized protein FKW44_014398, partial [Caligus rogercresseyi]